ncbi:hypothetical protein KBZ10_17490 [Streptomyces sp. F63]|uniref:hypothetical protein n=1 Tax=Streptomyces sp. F63 TaxID=2824887 RepID=UPI001B3582AC|nr:hypothetical protein [Streptomyces sp. F63]MBQ0986276.1 hypothetical protein [Streptomyces sp. F63]
MRRTLATLAITAAAVGGAATPAMASGNYSACDNHMTCGVAPLDNHMTVAPLDNHMT